MSSAHEAFGPAASRLTKLKRRLHQAQVDPQVIDFITEGDDESTSPAYLLRSDHRRGLRESVDPIDSPEHSREEWKILKQLRYGLHAIWPLQTWVSSSFYVAGIVVAVVVFRILIGYATLWFAPSVWLLPLAQTLAGLVGTLEFARIVRRKRRYPSPSELSIIAIPIFVFAPVSVLAFAAFLAVAWSLFGVVQSFLTHSLSWLQACGPENRLNDRSTSAPFRRLAPFDSLRRAVSRLLDPPASTPNEHQEVRHRFDRAWFETVAVFALSLAVFLFFGASVVASLWAIVPLVIFALWKRIAFAAEIQRMADGGVDLRSEYRELEANLISAYRADERDTRGWQSPVGSVDDRIRQLDGAVSLFAASLIITACYFPLAAIVAPNFLPVARADVTYLPALFQQVLPSQAEHCAAETWPVLSALATPAHIARNFEQGVTLPEIVADGSSLLSTFAQTLVFFGVAFVFCRYLPLFVLRGFAVGLIARPLLHAALYHETLGAKETVPKEKEAETTFAQLTERVRSHPDPWVRRHHAYGWYADGRLKGYPVVLDYEVRRDKVEHITGRPGSGKTSFVFGQIENRILSGDSVVFADFKASQNDSATLGWLMEMGKKHGIPVLFFSLFGPSLPFPILRQRHYPTESLFSAELLNQTLAFNYGPGYGSEHFQTALLGAALRMFERAPLGSTPQDLAAVLRDPALWQRNTRQQDDARDLGEKLNMLARVRHLAIHPNDRTISAEIRALAAEHEIQMLDLFERQCICVFNLPATYAPATSRSVGRFVLWSLLTAANSPMRTGKHHVSFFLDEAQDLVGSDLKELLNKGRGTGIVFTFLHQDVDQLEEIDPWIKRRFANTGEIRIDFGSLGDHILQEMSLSSGPGLFTTSSATDSASFGETTAPSAHYSRTYSFSDADQIRPVFSVNDLRKYAAKPGHSLMKLGSSMGLAKSHGHWFPMRTGFAISPKHYDALKRTAWPSVGDYPGLLPTPLPSSEHRPVTAPGTPSLESPPARSVDEDDLKDLLS